MSNVPIIFDRKIKAIHRDRASKLLKDNDFLIEESAECIAELFDNDIAATFPDMLEIGSRNGHLSQKMVNRAGINTITESDLSAKCLAYPRNYTSTKIRADEEFLPFADNSFNLVLSSLSLHWVNDLPGTFAQINRILKDKGLFVATIFGPQTLIELREAITQTEIRLKGGVSPRISPFLEVKEAGALLQRAGFEFPVTDSTVLTAKYENIFKLFHDLRAMGETNAMHKRLKTFTSKSTLTEIDATYKRLFSDEEGLIDVSFELVTMTGWKN